MNRVTSTILALAFIVPACDDPERLSEGPNELNAEDLEVLDIEELDLEDDSSEVTRGTLIGPGVESVALNNGPTSLTSKKDFYISNPNGKSKKYRVTPTCGAGTLLALALPALNTVWQQTQVGNQYYASYQCQNVGTLKVTVYCTNGTPKLSYWFYDC